MAEKKTREEVVAEKSASKEAAPAEAAELDYGEVEIEQPDGSFQAYASKEVLFAKQIDGKFKAGKDSGEAGDYYTIDAEGKTGALSADELEAKYVPVSENKRLTAGSVKVQGY